MGSFTELTLALRFSTDAPPEVLGAFAEWRTGSEAPALPALDDALSPDSFDADEYLASWFGDGPPPVGSLPVLEQAALWRYVARWGPNAYFPGTPSTSMRWEPIAQQWTLTTRALPKESGAWVQSIIAPLGEFAVDGSPHQPWFAGYLLDEYSPRPVLIWSAGREPFRFEGQFRDT